MHFLSREATIAKIGFNRWLVPPAAIAVHMCIGEVYGFSVFNVPLTESGGDWTIPQVGWLHPFLITHNWFAFGDLFRDPVAWHGVTHGAYVAAAYAVVFWLAAWARLAAKDITS